MEQVHSPVASIDLLESKLEAKKADLRDLATMGAVITSQHNTQALLSVVLEMAIRLVNGEVGIILMNAADELIPAISWGVDGFIVQSLQYKEMNLAEYSFKNRESVILQHPETHLPNSSIQSVVALPIQTSQSCFGVIMIINKSDDSLFDHEDTEKLEMLLRFVAVALDNAELLKEKLKQQKTEQEMVIAKQVQETILPQDIDNLRCVDVGAVYFPAQDVGGDFYDIFKISDKKFIVTLGDVSNKGVPAALVMSAASGIIKSTLATNPQVPIEALAQITNDTLCTGIIKEREMFITLFFAIFDLEEMTVTSCNAGHLPGLLWQDSNKAIRHLQEGGPIIGQFEGMQFQKETVPLNQGDRLFLFTDGLTEAADSDGRMFGLERVEEMYIKEAMLPPKEFCLAVKEWVDNFTVNCPEETVDDFTIMQIKIL